jgi:hypothetical protein
MTHTHMAVHQNPQHPVAIPALFRSILNHIDAQSPEFQRMVTSSTSKVDGSKTFPQKKSHLNSSSGSLPLFSPTPPGSQALVAVEAVHSFDGREGLPLPQDLARARRALVRQRADGDAFRRDLRSRTTGQPKGGPVKLVEFTRK